MFENGSVLPELKFDDLFNNLPSAPQNKNDLVIVGERRHKLNKSRSKYVSTGLSSDFCYNPCIKLCGNKCDAIIFDEMDWNHFLTFQGYISNYIHTNVKTEPIDAGNFSIQFMQISNSAVVKIVKNNSYIYMGYESICKLWEVLPLVKYGVDMLKRQQFNNYFNNVRRELQRRGGNVFENAVNLIERSNNSNNENVYMLMELVYIYPEVFEVDCFAKA